MDRFSRDTHTSADDHSNGHHHQANAFHSYNKKKSTPTHTFSSNPHGQSPPPSYGGVNNNHSPTDGSSTQHSTNAQLAHTNAATSYSAVAANDKDANRDECNSTAFRNYNNYVKKAIIQNAIDVVAGKLAAVDTETTRKKAAEDAAAGGANPNTVAPICNGSFGGGANNNSPPPPYASATAGGTPPGGSSRATSVPLAHRLYFGPNGKGITVLDLASGRGGDIGKWIFGQSPSFQKLLGQHTNDPSKFVCVKKYIAVDIAGGAVEAAQQRYIESKGQDNERLMKIRHHTPIADGHFFVGNCLIGSFFDAPPTPPPVVISNGSARSPSLGGLPPPMLTDSPTVRPRNASTGPSHLPPPPPSYNDAVASLGGGGGGIIGRSHPNTPHQAPHRASPSTLRQTGLERFGALPQTNSPSLSAASHNHHQLPPPFAGLPPPASGGTAQPASHLAEAMHVSAAEEVNIVSVQFAFHYACFSSENLRQALRGIARALGTSGGLVLLTTVDGAQLTKRLVNAYNNQVSGKAMVEYHSKLYSLTAETSQLYQYVSQIANNTNAVDETRASMPLGTMYRFKLEGLVDCEEFVVPFEALVDAAAAEGLKLIESKPFDHWLPEFSSNKKVKQQLGSDADMSADDMDLVSIYRTYVFEL